LHKEQPNILTQMGAITPVSTINRMVIRGSNIILLMQSPQLGETKLAVKYLYIPNSLVSTDKILVNKKVRRLLNLNKVQILKLETVKMLEIILIFQIYNFHHDFFWFSVSLYGMKSKLRFSLKSWVFTDNPNQCGL
jgi:hypothetical protein